MNRALVEGWNEVVGEGDTVWALGDFALGTIAETLPLAGGPGSDGSPVRGTAL
jgi:hypothetical protein